MAFQTRDEAQDKVSRKLDRVLNKKKKQVPLSQESWDDLNRRGASLAEQEQWIVLRRRQKDRGMQLDGQGSSLTFTSYLKIKGYDSRIAD